MSSDKQESRREIAEQIAEEYRKSLSFDLGEIVRLSDSIEFALKERDERAVRLIREHRASDKCDMDCWTTISNVIRNEEPHA